MIDLISEVACTIDLFGDVARTIDLIGDVARTDDSSGVQSTEKMQLRGVIESRVHMSCAYV